MVRQQCLLRFRIHQRSGRRRQAHTTANYLPVHTTFDVSAGHTFRENWSLSANVLNVTNHRVLLDNSVTIGGFHYNDPRIILRATPLPLPFLKRRHVHLLLGCHPERPTGVEGSAVVLRSQLSQS